LRRWRVFTADELRLKGFEQKGAKGTKREGGRRNWWKDARGCLAGEIPSPVREGIEDEDENEEDEASRRFHDLTQASSLPFSISPLVSLSPCPRSPFASASFVPFACFCSKILFARGGVSRLN
jgi:hypothetical protein